MYDDWDLIEASFATQYGVRLADLEKDMPHPEFCRLLKNISPKTPLGNIVSIRVEEDRDVLKHFTPEQKRIRDEWRSNHSQIDGMSKEDMEKATKEVQNIFANAFGVNSK